jgi:hypothetical protein
MSPRCQYYKQGDTRAKSAHGVVPLKHLRLQRQAWGSASELEDQVCSRSALVLSAPPHQISYFHVPTQLRKCSRYALSSNLKRLRVFLSSSLYGYLQRTSTANEQRNLPAL